MNVSTAEYTSVTNSRRAIKPTRLHNALVRNHLTESPRSILLHPAKSKLPTRRHSSINANAPWQVAEARRASSLRRDRHSSPFICRTSFSQFSFSKIVFARNIQCIFCHLPSYTEPTWPNLSSEKKFRAYATRPRRTTPRVILHNVRVEIAYHGASIVNCCW